MDNIVHSILDIYHEGKVYGDIGLEERYRIYTDIVNFRLRGKK